jgi:hypothetical protein
MRRARSTIETIRKAIRKLFAVTRVMPSTLKDELAKEDLDAVIAYLLTLK